MTNEEFNRRRKLELIDFIVETQKSAYLRDPANVVRRLLFGYINRKYTHTFQNGDTKDVIVKCSVGKGAVDYLRSQYSNSAVT